MSPVFPHGQNFKKYTKLTRNFNYQNVSTSVVEKIIF